MIVLAIFTFPSKRRGGGCPATEKASNSQKAMMKNIAVLQDHLQL
jgi:hypothetical protein